MKDTHLDGFNLRSRSEQCLSIVWRAAAWSFIEEENTERSSAYPFTLCVLHCLVFVIVAVGGGLGRYHLPFPGAGNQLVLERLIDSSILPLR